MAFRPSTARSNTRAAAPAQDNDDWKADAFINFYIPRATGTKGKIGAIALKKGNEHFAKLIEFLLADPKNVETFKSQMIIEVQSAAPVAGNEFLLG